MLTALIEPIEITD